MIRDQLRHARRLLALWAGCIAVLWGALAALLVVTLVVVAGAFVVIPAAVLETQLWVGALTGAVTALSVVGRNRGLFAPAGVALWLEEQLSASQYAIVTSAELGDAASLALLRAAMPGSWVAVIRRAAWRAARLPLALIVVTGMAAVLLSRGGLRRPAGLRAGSSRLIGRRGDPLRDIVAQVTPPRYSAERSSTIDNPSTVTALVGSQIGLSGDGDGTSLRVRIDALPLTIAVSADRWDLTIAMPTHAAAVRLSDGAHSRWLVLEPRVDSVPVVTLNVPAQDTVASAFRAKLQLAAVVHDDLGIDAAWFEVVISSGDGELVKSRTTVVGQMEGGDRRDMKLQRTLRTDSLGLQPGDVVSIRALARDRNDVSGPGLGASDTRTLRLARPGDGEALDVATMPPTALDSSLLSQRLLIITTEALVAHRRTLEVAQFTAQARRIGADQARVRRAVSDVIFARLSTTASGEEGGASPSGRDLDPGQLLKAAKAATTLAAASPLDFGSDESPVVATNRPLLEAYNAMWDATRALDIGEAANALPAMRAALAAIERSRRAERLYLRGGKPAPPVDVARVRLTGARGDVHAGTRTARPADSTARRWQARIDIALRLLLRGNRPAATDSLLLLRVQVMAQSPVLAAALAHALDELAANRNASMALTAVRRAAGEGAIARPASAWSARW